MARVRARDAVGFIAQNLHCETRVHCLTACASTRRVLPLPYALDMLLFIPFGMQYYQIHETLALTDFHMRFMYCPEARGYG